MKRITYFVLFFFLASASIFAQEELTLSGVVTSEKGYPLPGADILVKGTSQGTVTNFDGEYSFTTKDASGTLIISYVGYISQEFPFSGANTTINASLKESALGLKEVMIVASVAVDRKTPVAASTIKKEEIKLKLGNQEFPEILKSTPGVYVTRNGGGFGDGEVTMRGFNSENVAVLINGIPVNDMENGRVFWSNWAGLGNVTSLIQSQRGLGAAKIAVPSIGGTINTITESTDAEKGGFVGFDLGNDGYVKYGAKVSTGLQDNGLAVTAYADRTYGDNVYADGTNFSAISYFLNVAYKLNEEHKLAFNVFGAKQRHGQRQNLSLINDYRLSERGLRYNPDWGYKNGEVLNIEDNFYHKPLASLNHYWKISDKSALSTSIYGSTGTGGGGGIAGEEASKFSDPTYKLGNFGPVDIDRIVDENTANGGNGSSALLRASRNDHVWVGGLSVFNTKLSDFIDLNVGLDYRWYVGEHFREVTDLLGGQYYFDDSDINEPVRRTLVGDKIDYHDKGYHRWIGGFAQAEYDDDVFSAFIAGNYNNSSYRREDFFQKLDGDPEQLTDPQDFNGFGFKGGGNYRFGKVHNVFINAGYFERVPFLDDVWLNFSNDDLNEAVQNQKITSFEVGYGLRSEKVSANLNLYHTVWKNRTETADGGTGEDLITANINGIEALHQGFEFDMQYKPFEFLTFTGMVSFGDWKWQNDVTGIQFFDIDRNVVVDEETGQPIVVDVFLKGKPVGRSAQTTSALGMVLDVSSNTSFTLDYNYNDRFYADFDLQDINTDPWQVPDFYTIDTTLSHKFEFGNFEAQIIGRIFNLFDEEYITQADNGASGTAVDALVFFGPGRTFSISSIINF